ncbi:MAG: hypothetical protein HFI40_02490 [Lachnospiraceae bacterium]|jgi:hypothetical protein|nr:hypothetical protein [Lachnospiraceae bacterium]MCX4317243.1 hypothetical protein [Lachnospiraceae bacterium]
MASCKRLHLIPLILGGYGAFLGFGLAVIGLAEIKEGLGMVRFLTGLGMAGFGLLGIWDGVRDLIRPEKRVKTPPVSQFILTDTSGNKTSLVTPELLQKQLDLLAENEVPKRFTIQLLPPLSTKEHGLLAQILCIYYRNIVLVAFFETPKGSYQIYQNSAEPNTAMEWLKQLLIGSPDFSGWERIETKTGQDEDTARQNEDDIEQNEQMFYWHRLLVIFGESWHDEHKFFSVRDVELAIEGIHEGKYEKAALEWGTETLDLFPGVQSDLLILWHTNPTRKEFPRFLAKEGTVIQVKFWLTGYLERGFFEEMSGWTDVSDQMETPAMFFPAAFPAPVIAGNTIRLRKMKQPPMLCFIRRSL